MKTLKLFQYAYLVIAFLFLYKGITEWSSDREGAYISFFFTALAVAVFFFRKRFSKKFEDRDNK